MIRTLTPMQVRCKIEKFIDSQFGTPAGDHLKSVDVRSPEEFERKHIFRSVNLPPEHAEKDPDSRLTEHGQEILLYGRDAQDETPWSVARILEQKGFPNLYVLEGGLDAWVREGFGVQTDLVDADGKITGPAWTPLERAIQEKKLQSVQPQKMPSAKNPERKGAAV